MTSNLKALDFDSLFEELGGLGKFQWFILSLCCYSAFISGIYLLSPIFGGKELGHRCKVPPCDNDTTSYKEDFLNFTVPWDNKDDKWNECYQFSQQYITINDTLELSRYSYNSSFYSSSSSLTCNPVNFNELDIIPCEEWVYDTSEFQCTSFCEFNLPCDKKWMVPFESSVSMAGLLVGSVVTGAIADKFGRKCSILVSAITLCLSGLVGSLSPNYYFLLVTRFFGGCGSMGCFSNAFITTTEVIGPKWRPLCGILLNTPFSFGNLLMVLFAYYIRNWRYFYFAIATPGIFAVSFYWIFPESIRWLIVRNRIDEALVRFRQVARYNKTDIPLDLKEKLINEKIRIEEIGSEKRRSIFDVMRSPIMRRRSIILFYCWMVCSLVYYGLSTYVGSFSGNIFINFTLIVFVEIPGFILSAIAANIFGRKLVIIVGYITGGIACITAASLSEESSTLIFILSLIGKFGITAAFGTIFLYTGEIYPTEYRGIGLGVCSMHSRIGGIIAPFIAYISIVYQSLPSLIFGSSSLIAGLLFFLLPETVGEKYPQTLKESEEIGKGQVWYNFKICDAKEKNPENIRL